MPLRIRNHIQYPVREPEPEPQPVFRIRSELNEAIDAELLKRTPSKQISAMLGTDSQRIASRRLFLRNKDLL